MFSNELISFHKWNKRYYMTVTNLELLVETPKQRKKTFYDNFFCLAFSTSSILLTYYLELARTLLTTSFQPFLSSIARGSSGGSSPVSSTNWSMKDLDGLPGFLVPCVGFQRMSSLAISSLFQNVWPTKRTLLSSMISVILRRLSYSWVLWMCSLHKTLRTAWSNCVNTI